MVFGLNGDFSQVWGAKTGEALLARMNSGDNADFSPDGQWVAVAGNDGLAQVFEASTGTPITPPVHHNGVVWGVRFHPDGRRFGTANIRKLVQIWNITSSQFEGPVLRHTKPVSWAGFSPDGGRPLTASVDGTARLWDAATGKQAIPELEHGGFENYRRPSFSRDGKRVLTASAENVIQWWDTDTGEPVAQAMRHQESVHHAELSLATGASFRTLSAPRTRRNTRFGWNVASLRSETAGQVTRIAVGAPANPSGSLGQVHLYDAVTSKLILSFGAPAPKSGDWFGASLAAIGDMDGDGRMDLAVGAGGEDNGLNSSPGSAYIVSGETGKLLHPLIPPDLPAITRHRWSVAAVPDVNGDGKADVLVGVPLASPLGDVVMAGRAYLFRGGDGRWLRTIKPPDPAVRGFFGWAVAGLPDITGDGVVELLISAAARPSVGSLGERRVHLINGATGQRIQTFKSLGSGEAFGFSITGILDRAGKLRAIASGAAIEPVPPAPNRAGRAYAFPLSLSFLSMSVSDEGPRISLIATDDKGYEVEASPDLQTWMSVTTLKDGTPTGTFLDNQTKGANQRFYRARKVSSSP